jgi:cell division septal protein FtsQ
MDLQQIGRIALIIGISIVILGVVLIVLGSSDFFTNLFNAGTIRFEGNNITCFIPIVASILLSIILTVVLNIVIRFLNK